MLAIYITTYILIMLRHPRNKRILQLANLILLQIDTSI